MTSFGRILETHVRPYDVTQTYEAYAKWLLQRKGLVYNTSVYPESDKNTNK